MTLFVMWLTSILLVPIGMIGFSYYQRKRNIKSLKEKQLELIQKNELWQEQWTEIRAEVEKSRVTLVVYQDTKEQVQRQIDNLKAQVEVLTEEQLEIAKHRADTELQLYETLRMIEIKREFEELYNRVQENYLEEVAKQAELEQEVKSLEGKQKALLDLWKREDMEQQEKDYYRIILGPAVLEDIKYIQEILGKLTNKKVISEIVFKSFIYPSAKEMINRVVGTGKVCGIYRISHIDSRKSYIGQGVDVGNRLMQHIRGSFGIQTIADQPVHKVMSEEGLDKWMFELVEECSREELTEKEKYYIMQYESNVYGYNKRVG